MYLKLDIDFDCLYLLIYNAYVLMLGKHYTISFCNVYEKDAVFQRPSVMSRPDADVLKTCCC